MKDTATINDLYDFYRLFVASNFKKNQPAQHIQILSGELMKMKLGEYKRLCVSMPPRTSKSSLITLAFPLWLILSNPDLNILIINNSASLSERFGIQLRELFIKYGAAFNVHLSDVKHSSSYLMFENSEGELYKGSIRLVGAGGSITGQDADYVIVDDPYKGFEDITPTLLDKKIDWFETIVEQRLEPESRLIILHTRWHTKDLQGYLKENFPGKYKFLSFSALNDDGTCLWPERYTPEYFLEKQEAMGDRLFQSIYQQKPLDDTSDFFNMDMLRFEEGYDVSNSVASVRGWDIASSDPSKNNDYTSGARMYLTDDGLFVINGLVHGQYGNRTVQMIKRTAQTDTPNTMIIIETGVAAAGKLLYEEWRRQLQGYRVIQAKPITSKEDRATPLANAITDGKVIIDLPPDQREKLIREFNSFPLGEHDDIVDSISHAYNYLFNKMKAKSGVVYL